MGQSPDSKGYNTKGEGLPLIQGNADIKNHETIKRFYTRSTPKVALSGDVILTVRAPVGSVAKTSFDCCLGRGVCALKKAPPFLFHFLEYIEPSWGRFSGGSTFDSINSISLNNITIQFPDQVTQDRISFYFDSINKNISSLESLLHKYEAIKKSTIFLLMKPKAGWTKRKLSDVCENFSGLTYAPENISTGGTLVLRSSNIQNEALSFDDSVFVDCKIPERATVKTGDLLVCVRNGSKKLIGKSAIISPDANGMAFGAFMTILRATSIDQRFLAYLWQSPAIQRQVGESLGATINQITNADIKRFEISCPNTIEEQNRIASKIFVLDEIIKKTQAQLVKAKGIKQGLMNYFFS